MPQTMIQVRHNFETAHRLPFLGGKCANLHGHSWNATISLVNVAQAHGVNGDGISVEYALVKKVIRTWIDDKLDHGTMLGYNDLLVRDPNISRLLGKVFIFGVTDINWGDEITDSYSGYTWPTVEAVAEMLAVKLQKQLTEACGKYIRIESVDLDETAVNSVTYIADISDGVYNPEADRL